MSQRPRVQRHARWLKANMEPGSRLDELVEEVTAWMEEQGILEEVGEIPRSTVHRWTKDVRARGKDWDGDHASPDEFALVQPVYRAGLERLKEEAEREDQGKKRTDVNAWPSSEEADWWIKWQKVLPEFPAENVYAIGRYAAAETDNERQAIARTLMDYSVDRGARVGANGEELAVGGTAIVDMDNPDVITNAAEGSPQPR